MSSGTKNVKKFYLDSSAYVKGFRNERYSEIVHDILEKSEQGKLIVVISEWTLNECIAGLDKACHLKHIIPKEEMDDIIRDMLIYTHDYEGKGCIEIVQPEPGMIHKSVAFIRWYHLSADDALHTVCAESREVNALVLEDMHFSNMLKQPKKIEDPREEQCPKIQFKVLNLADSNDYMELQSIITNL